MGVDGMGGEGQQDPGSTWDVEATGLCDQEGEAEEGRDHEEVTGLREG